MQFKTRFVDFWLVLFKITESFDWSAKADMSQYFSEMNCRRFSDSVAKISAFLFHSTYYHSLYCIFWRYFRKFRHFHTFSTHSFLDNFERDEPPSSVGSVADLRTGGR